MSKLETSRRSFLKWAGAASATVANAGASTASAAAGALASGAASLPGTAKAAATFEKIVRGGGFPYKALLQISRKLEKSEDNISRLVARLYSKAPFSWKEHFYDYSRTIPAGHKIDFSLESWLLTTLHDMPRDIPILDYLDDTVIQTALEGAKAIYAHDALDNRHLRALNLEQMQEARKVFTRICTPETTAKDILDRLEGYFVQLAEHALTNPSDFGMHINGSWKGNVDTHIMPPDSVICSSDIDQLRYKLGMFSPFDKRSPERHKLIQNLRQTAEDYTSSQTTYGLQIAKQQWEAEASNREKAFSANEKSKSGKTAASPHNSYYVNLFCAHADTHAVIAEIEEHPQITRMDWLHWVQMMDPENARASDLIPHPDGLGLIVKNEKARAFLRAELQQKQRGILHIALPNRRIGVDLHNSEYAPPQHPSPVQD